jgi:secondary thiamine-phosphate synthase enzyme
MVDITAQVRNAIRELGLHDGVAVVFVPHTTAGITIQENADPDVIHDVLKELSKIVPYQDAYHHAEGNSAAHIKTSLFGSSVHLLVEEGELMLGTWQGVYFCEFDGPRTRKAWVKVVGAGVV